MDHYELIRRKRLVDGLSIRAISRELGHSRKTIRKALKHATPPGYQRCQPVALPVMDGVCPNCHMRTHHGVDGQQLNDQLKAHISRVENEQQSMP